VWKTLFKTTPSRLESLENFDEGQQGRTSDLDRVDYEVYFCVLGPIGSLLQSQSGSGH